MRMEKAGNDLRVATWGQLDCDMLRPIVTFSYFCDPIGVCPATQLYLSPTTGKVTASKGSQGN